MSNSLRPHGLQPTRLLRPWDFPGKSTGVGCHIHLQSRNRVTDVENKLAVTKERNGVMNWRIGIDIYTPLCIKGITIEPLLYSKGNSSQCSVVAEMRRKSKKEGTHVYLWLVREARKHIIAGDFAEWRDMMLPKVTKRL